MRRCAVPSSDIHDGGVAGIARKDRVSAGVGTSESTDAVEAGRAATAAALSRLAGKTAGLILVYASVRYDLSALLGGVHEIAGDTPVVGATSSGHFYSGELMPPGRGVAVLALTEGPYRFGTGAVTGLSVDAFAAGRAVARAARTAAGPDSAPHSALLIFADGLAGDQQTLLNGAHKVVGAAVPVVGGAAGDDRLLSKTFVFHGDQVLTDAVVAIWIDSPWPLTVVAGHGWQPIGLPLLVTKVDGTAVYEIAGRPATEVFNEITVAHLLGDDVRSGDPAGYKSTHAFGLIQPDGSHLIRGAYQTDDGLIRTFAPLPAYAAVEVVSCGQDDLLEVIDEIVPRALDGREAGVLLAFSCVARLDILGDRSSEEPARLQAVAGAAPTFGFFTYGEFARTGSVAGYHNATLAAIAL